MGPMDKYEILKELGDGTFGSVLMAKNVKSGETVAIKQIKKKFENWDELREVKALARLRKHPNIIQLLEVIRDHKLNELNYVFEYMNGGNMFDKMREIEAGGYMMEEADVKIYSYQLLQGLKHIHAANLFHRDLKPENLLLSGASTLKIADFGLAREIKGGDPHSEYVTTRWYRAPEILLKSPQYTAMMDMWSAGTVIAEFIMLQAVLPGTSEVDQIFKTCSLIGSPFENDEECGVEVEREDQTDNREYHRKKQLPERSEITGGGAWSDGIRLAKDMGFTFPTMNAVPLEQIMDHASTASLHLVGDMLKWDPAKRPSAGEAVEHPWFDELRGDHRFFVEEAPVLQVKQRESLTAASPARSRESTVVERPLFKPSQFSRKSSQVRIVDETLSKQYGSHSKAGSTDPNDFSRRNSTARPSVQETVERDRNLAKIISFDPPNEQSDDSPHSRKIEQEKLFIQQRRELSALEKVAEDAVKTLAVKQKQLQHHLVELAQGLHSNESRMKPDAHDPFHVKTTARGNKKRMMERIQGMHFEKRAMESVHSLVLQQKNLQRQLEKMAVDREFNISSPDYHRNCAIPIVTDKISEERAVKNGTVARKKSAKPQAILRKTSEANASSGMSPTDLPPLPIKVTVKNADIGGRKSSDSEEHEWGHLKELKTVIKNAEHFGNGVKEHQKFRRMMIQFLRNLESETFVTTEFLQTPTTDEDREFPADWKEKSVSFGARLKDKIGELVSLYNEFHCEMEGIANEPRNLFCSK